MQVFLSEYQLKRCVLKNNIFILRVVYIGALLSLLSILFSFLMGASFGISEESYKNRLKSSAEEVFYTVYKGDVEKKDAVVKKSWNYMQRAHLHAGSIGATALAGVACMMVLTASTPGVLGSTSAFLWGLGGLLYGLFWLFAGFEAPHLGSTALAKESFEVLGVSGAACSILGAGGVFLSVLLHFFRLR